MSNDILIGGKPLSPERQPSQTNPEAKVIIKGNVEKTEEGGIEISSPFHDNETQKTTPYEG